MSVLTLNIGSSSLRVDVLEDDDSALAEQHLEHRGDLDETLDAIAPLIEKFQPQAVAHRVVHGGDAFDAPVIVDDSVMARLRELVPLDPLHMPPAVDLIEGARSRFADIPQVAVFDTLFHRTMPDTSKRYAIPRDWEQAGVRRYGFHGLSYAHSVKATRMLLPGARHLVVAHLGGGCSVCAIRDGESVWTSMGFSSLEGLPMTTRSGSIDPAAVLWVRHRLHLDDAGISDALQHRSGLLALSGGRSDDTRELVKASTSDPDAAFALALFTDRVAAEIAGAATRLPRLDAVIFTGEIGFDQHEIRQAVTDRLAVLGVQQDLQNGGDDDAVIGEGAVDVAIVRTREELELAAAARSLLEAR